jgi:hypothetical protein
VTAMAKICGFLLLLGLVFGVAHAAGARLGPVTASYSQTGRGGTGAGTPGGTMNMGGMTGPGGVP